MSDFGVVNPEEDPTFLAFQRALGVEESELRSSIALRQSAINRRVATALPQAQEQTRQNVRDVGYGYASRGLFGSGVRAVAQNEANMAGQQQQGQIVTQGADESAALNSELARSLAEQRRRQAEQELNTRQSLAIDAANVGAR